MIRNKVTVCVVMPGGLTLPEALDAAAQFAHRGDCVASFEFGEPPRLFHAWHEEKDEPQGPRAEVRIAAGRAGKPGRWAPILNVEFGGTGGEQPKVADEVVD